jgi:hypothetical protein
MASTSETGHAKNVANFEDLISFCTGYAAAYNPTKASLKLAALNTLLTSANAALLSVKTAKTAYDNASNARENAFLPLKPLATKIVNALAATDALAQTVDDAKSINLKIQGRRAAAAKATEPPVSASETGTEPAPKKASVSQQSFDSLIDHFTRLIQLLVAEPKYIPNETELKVATLNTLLADLKAKNTAVITATTALSNARIARDKLLYAENTGLCDIGLDVKLYVKSLFGASSPQYKQVSSLKFKP